MWDRWLQLVISMDFGVKQKDRIRKVPRYAVATGFLLWMSLIFGHEFPQIFMLSMDVIYRIKSAMKMTKFFAFFAFKCVFYLLIFC